MNKISNLFKKKVTFFLQIRGSTPIQITAAKGDNLMKVLSDFTPCRNLPKNFTSRISLGL